ncbi:MAG: hypothetical protein ACR2J3_03955 [Aridibacter sp.]
MSLSNRADETSPIVPRKIESETTANLVRRITLSDFKPDCAKSVSVVKINSSTPATF